MTIKKAIVLAILAGCTSFCSKIWAAGVTVTIAKEGNADGRVWSEPAGIECAPGCVTKDFTWDQKGLTLRAEPETGARFVGWSGVCTGATDCSLTSLGFDKVTVRPHFQSLGQSPDGATSLHEDLAPAPTGYFHSTWQFEVFHLNPSEGIVSLGKTPAPADYPVQLPAGLWYVQVREPLGNPQMPALIREMNRLQIPGLDLTSTAVTLAGAGSLTQIRNLHWLLWRGPVVNDHMVDLAAQIPSLSSLTLSPVDPDDSDNPESSLPQNTGITDQGAAALARLNHLTYLDLSGNAIGNKGAASLAALPHLAYLDLSETQVTPIGLAALVQLPSLRVLVVSCLFQKDIERLHPPRHLHIIALASDDGDDDHE